jgi:hypothetical protein
MKATILKYRRDVRGASLAHTLACFQPLLKASATLSAAAHPADIVYGWDWVVRNLPYAAPCLPDLPARAQVMMLCS